MATTGIDNPSQQPAAAEQAQSSGPDNDVTWVQRHALWPRSWGWEGFAAATGAAGVALYLMLRVIVAQFYTPLGITLEEAGFDKAALLAASAFGLIVTLVLYTTGWVALLLGTRFSVFKPVLKEDSRMREAAIFALFTVTCVGGFGIGFVLAAVLPGFWSLLAAIVAVGLLMLMLGAAVRPVLDWQPRLAGVAGALGSLALLVGYGLFGLAAVAREDAATVRQGSVPSGTLANVPFFPYLIRVGYVEDADTRPSAEKCVLYLGKSERGVVVFDPEKHRTRLMPSDTEVQIDSSADECS